jgi:hypothetical protein
LTSVVIAGAGAVVAPSCGIYDTSLLFGLDAGPDVQKEAGDGSTSGCAHVRWPDRPAADDPSPGDVAPFYLAVRTLDFGVREDGGPPPLLGFDLDNFCTCNPDPESCKVTVDAAPHCDLEGGVDNAGLVLVRQFSAFPGFFQQSYINNRINQGYYGAVIRIERYNGKANDTQVQVSYFPSNGTSGIEVNFPTAPSWDGNDRWTIDPASINGGVIPDGGDPSPKYIDQSAYVSNYTAVANLSFPIAIGASAGDNTLTVDLVGAVVMAKLVPEGPSFRVEEGMIAGRWATTKMLTALQVLHDPFNIQDRLCGTNGTYQLIKDKICRSADIATNVLEDGKNAPCGALTVGVAFTAWPAKVGGTFPRNDAGTPCGPQWVDSCPQ